MRDAQSIRKGVENLEGSVDVAGRIVDVGRDPHRAARQRSEALGGIDERNDSARTTKRANASKVGGVAGQGMNPSRTEQARRIRDRFGPFVRFNDVVPEALLESTTSEGETLSNAPTARRTRAGTSRKRSSVICRGEVFQEMASSAS